MPNYFNFESEKVKEYWDYKTKSDKLFNVLLYVTIGIFLGINFLSLRDKLNINTLSLGIFIILGIIIWYISKETTDLHNRINILEEALDKKVDRETMQYHLDEKKDK